MANSSWRQSLIPSLLLLDFHHWLHMSSLDDLPRELTALIRGYSAVVPTRNLQFPILYDCESLQICLIKDILTDRHLNTSPPSTQYQRSFWKWVLNHLEEQSKNQAWLFWRICLFGILILLQSPRTSKFMVTSTTTIWNYCLCKIQILSMMIKAVI